MRLKPPNFPIIFLSLLIFGCASQQQNIITKDDTTIVKPHCYDDAAKQFLRWNKSNGKELKGLTKRRQDEMNLFLKDCNK